MKILSGKELVGYVKERQYQEIKEATENGQRVPRLVILRDSDDPVIMKYVGLKMKYGEDIGVKVDNVLCKSVKELKSRAAEAGRNEGVDGIIVQLPIKDKKQTEYVLSKIVPEKDVDGLNEGDYDGATATAINWLMAGYGIDLAKAQIGIIGRGRLIGAPLKKMWRSSGYKVWTFHKGSNFDRLKRCDVIVTGTGVPGVLRSTYVKPGAFVIDAGTASEGGVIVGDVHESVREREDLGGITPVYGGVGPLTVGALFENVIRAWKSRNDNPLVNVRGGNMKRRGPVQQRKRRHRRR